VRNDSWTFESVRATKGVSNSGRYGYELELHTDGIIQGTCDFDVVFQILTRTLVGWATASCSFDAERGDGVGGWRL
jgi:hypothetical protein